MSRHKLPDSWLEIPFGEVVAYASTSKIESKYIKDNEWILELEDIEKDSSKLISRISFSNRRTKSTKNKFSSGDVLYGKLRPYLNKVILADMEGVCSTEIIPITAPIGIDNHYLFYSLRRPAFLQHAHIVSHCLNMPRLGTNAGKLAPFVLAPFNEQIRIANKLDSLLGKLEATQKHLGKIPTLLKRFRQSVLAAAVSGELIDIGDYENRHLGDVSIVQTGSTPLKSNLSYYENGTIPWLTSTVTGQQLVTSADKFVTDLAVKECRLKVFPKGTLLIAMYGEGKTRGQVTEIAIDATINQACAAITVDESLASKSFIKICIENNYEQTRLMAEGGAQPNLNLTKVRAIPITLPNAEEQSRIVHKVESLFKLADKVEQQYQAAKQRTDKLTQSILAKAFRGELVPQDPNDEPASELLKRIKATKAEDALIQKTKKNREGSSPKVKIRKFKVTISVIKALEEANKPLTGQELFSAAGYPNDADTKLVEKYFLDLRDQLENQSILKTRDTHLNEDVFELATSI